MTPRRFPCHTAADLRVTRAAERGGVRTIALAVVAAALFSTGCTPLGGVAGSDGDDAARRPVREVWPVWFDTARQREIRARLFVPASQPAPLVLFSHGVGESILGYEYLGRAWAAAGLAVLFVEHAGSDVAAVDWNAVTPSLLAVARDPATWTTRRDDLGFALDRALTAPPAGVQFDPSRIIVAGHSLGAHSALLFVGLRAEGVDGGAVAARDPRIVGCVLLSPHGLGVLGQRDDSWDDIDVPILSVFGSRDTDIITRDAATRRAVFEFARGSPRVQVVIPQVEHETFTGRDPALPFASAAPQQQALIAEITAAFLLEAPGDPAALAERIAQRCGDCEVSAAAPAAAR